MPDLPAYRRQVLDHLGLVAGMFDALGIGDVLEQATRQNPAMRDLTVGEAVKAMVLNGLGFLNHALSLVPRFFPNTPPSRLISPRVRPDQLHDEALGRALDTLYTAGGTELYSLIAATAAERLGLAPRVAHLDSTSLHVAGHYHSDDAPSEHVVHLTQGASRDQRPDLNHVRLALIVEHQAGIPVLRKPLSGHRREAQACGHVITAHLEQVHTPYGAPSLGADRALSSEANLATLAQTAMKWITRGPATGRDARAVLAHADPQAMAPLQEGARSQELPSPYGGVEQRWLLIYSEPRQPPAQRTVDKQLRQQRDLDGKAWKKLCSTRFACEADARQALAAFAQDLQATFLATRTVRPMPPYGKRGRPKPGEHPDQGIYQIAGALASSLAARKTRIDQHSCFILATNERAPTHLPPPDLLPGYQGQEQSERGFRFLQDPQLFAASLSLQKPERLMALLMVLTVCLVVYAALASRLRNARKAHDATLPNQKGQPLQNPTARWMFHWFVGMHLLLMPGQWPVVLTLTAAHQKLLRLLGTPYRGLYGVKYA